MTCVVEPRGAAIFGTLLRNVTWIASFAVCTILADEANACQICVPLPQRTLADRLIDSDAVVLAREDPNRPFRYMAIDKLKGSPGREEIDTFLNSSVRRLLKVHPERSMILTRDPQEGNWSAAGIADAEFLKVVRRIISYSDSWRPVETNNLQRLAIFAQLLGHPDSRLHELAYLEIGRAPYATIRKITAGVSIDTVRAMLDRRQYLEWRGLAILMLGESRAPSDRARVVRTFNALSRSSSAFNLSAWATAYLAIKGVSGVERIEQLYLARADRSFEELVQIFKALSAHGAEAGFLRDRIVSAYRLLLYNRPSMASHVVKDLMDWRRWDFADLIRSKRETLTTADEGEAFALDLYLQTAERGGLRSFIDPSLAATGKLQESRKGTRGGTAR